MSYFVYGKESCVNTFEFSTGAWISEVCWKYNVKFYNNDATVYVKNWWWRNLVPIADEVYYIQPISNTQWKQNPFKEATLKTHGIFSSERLHTQDITCPQRCYKKKTRMFKTQKELSVGLQFIPPQNLQRIMQINLQGDVLIANNI
jgi:hypothetical protein